ncbi:class I SAM-dependent methyltransferase [Halanaeroarchaeum sulfurireducens]|uniref:Methyltransferase type 11 n=1 Tax=Halanaeroarchaeum sulfurireducens TaxID=1604004 RepID=A0A0F7P9Z4_9EURY|nr:class I SAM-dependent methyltransferase [Halanaeroarchaeum sulfurireducens]AKH97607.1 methyltransferase type 11 [Halanaeroarchaeum sulfurireducens]ALG82003.1 methyltransferase type 11 [Halanaeroarchaeum sulfurireducens]
MDASDVREEWATRTGEYSPRYYAYYGPNEVSRALESHLDERVSRDASVLELGCSSGRHLKHLYDHGYEDLAGIEINEEAIEVMGEEYPAVAAEGEFYTGAIESVVESMADRAFDVVYSVQTLQHLHSDTEWVFDSIRRITGQFLVIVEIEGDEHRGDRDVAVQNVDGMPLTYRNWRDVFEGAGFSQVYEEEIDNNTLRVFERTDR